MKFAVETWDPAYGSSIEQADLESASQRVDPTVEVPIERWAPIDPDPEAVPGSILFIDGVRRIDTRVWITQGEEARPGLCATVAAGAIRCEGSSAEVVGAVVERGVYTAAEGVEPIVTSCGTYQVRSAHGDEDADLYLGVHNHMTHLETVVSDEQLGGRSRGCQLVVFDGPLRHRDAAVGVGYVKTQHVQYLEAAQQRVVAQLGEGQRTPLFAIGLGGRAPRWSWYLRLPGPITHPYAGVVRLELPGLGDAETASARADAVSAALPRFASEPHKEARAPQNLYPISGLEQQLRRRLGHPHLLEKALRRAAG